MKNSVYREPNYFTQTITNCADCKDHLEKDIRTADTFDHETGIYCGLTPDDTDSWERNTFGGPTNFRLVVADDRDPKKYARIPDWCPHILARIDGVRARLKENVEVKAEMARLKEVFVYDYGESHSLAVAHLGQQLLECDTEEYQGKNIRLLQIAALLHALGNYDDQIQPGYWTKSAICAERLLSSITELSTFEKMTIIKAINCRKTDALRSNPVAAALYFGEVLRRIANHFKKNLSLEEFNTLSEFEKQAFFTTFLTFRVERNEKTTGVLTLHYNHKGGLLYGFAPEFNPELLAERKDLIDNPREVAMDFLGLDDFEIRLSYKSPFYSADKAPEVTIIPKEAILGK